MPKFRRNKAAQSGLANCIGRRLRPLSLHIISSAFSNLRACELRPIEGIDFLGPLPPKIREITIFLDKPRPVPAAAAALPVIRRNGVEPA